MFDLTKKLIDANIIGMVNYSFYDYVYVNNVNHVQCAKKVTYQ